MIYNRLGSSGLRVSQFSFGSWVTFGTQVDVGLAKDQLAAAKEGGVNFFDNAEVYAGGESETTRERILDVAEALFAERGLADMLDIGWGPEAAVPDMVGAGTLGGRARGGASCWASAGVARRRAAASAIRRALIAGCAGSAPPPRRAPGRRCPASYRCTGSPRRSC